MNSVFLPTGDVYVFDVDGVLVDASERLKAALRSVGLEGYERPEDIEPGLRQAFWKVFLSPELLELDKPRETGIKLLLDRLGKGVVLILTGRPYRLFKSTVAQLKSMGVPMERTILVMRPNSERRRDVDFKASVLARIQKLVEIHDDDLKVLEAARRLHPQARLFLHFDDNYKEI